MEIEAVPPVLRYRRMRLQARAEVGWCPVSYAAPGHCCIVRQMMRFYAENVMGGFMELTFWHSGILDACYAIHVKILHTGI